MTNEELLINAKAVLEAMYKLTAEFETFKDSLEEHIQKNQSQSEER